MVGRVKPGALSPTLATGASGPVIGQLPPAPCSSSRHLGFSSKVLYLPEPLSRSISHSATPLLVYCRRIYD